MSPRRMLADMVLTARHTGHRLMALRVTRMRCTEHLQAHTVTMPQPPTARHRMHPVLRQALMVLRRPTGHPAEQRSPHMEHTVLPAMVVAQGHHRHTIQVRSTLLEPRCLTAFRVASPRLTTPAGLRLQEAQRPTAEQPGRLLLTACRSPREIRTLPAGTASPLSPALAPSIQAAHPAGHGQMTPGVGSVPEGYAGSDIPGAAAAPQQKFEEGTAEYAVQQLVMKMQTGNTEELDKLISEKTKDPVLQPLLEGKADEEQIQKNKELVAGATLASRRESGSSKLFVVNNAEGKVLTFTARKDGEAFKVVNIRVETPRGLKAREQQTGS